MATSVDVVRALLVDLIGRSAYGADFGATVSAAVHRVLPFDGWCLLGLDPKTGLRTFQFGQHGTEHTVEMAFNEALQLDVNKYADLARSATPAGWLAADHPLADQSFRFNEILLPQGFGSEMRLALRDGGHLWGALVLFRDHSRPCFNDDDVKLLLRLAPPLVSAVRRYPMRPFTTAQPGLAQGVALLSPDNEVQAISAPAQAWLDDLVPGGDDETRSTDVTRVLFDAANAARASIDDPAAAMAPIRTVSGRWLVVQGNRMPYGKADVAVLLQSATIQQLLPLLAGVYGLTRREETVLGSIAAGQPTKHIARRLRISPHTVTDHRKSIYRKAEVSGREELLGQLT